MLPLCSISPPPFFSPLLYSSWCFYSSDFALVLYFVFPPLLLRLVFFFSSSSFLRYFKSDESMRKTTGQKGPNGSPVQPYDEKTEAIGEDNSGDDDRGGLGAVASSSLSAAGLANFRLPRLSVNKPIRRSSVMSTSHNTVRSQRRMQNT